MTPIIEKINSQDYHGAAIELLQFLHTFFQAAYDYFYIMFLKYIFFIIDNYIIFFSISIPLNIFFYYMYKKITFQEHSFFGYLFIIIFNPITVILYGILFINSFFEKFIYYKMFGVDYLLDVPRKKRDYVLESKYRKELKSRDITLD